MRPQAFAKPVDPFPNEPPELEWPSPPASALEVRLPPDQAGCLPEAGRHAGRRKTCVTSEVWLSRGRFSCPPPRSAIDVAGGTHRVALTQHLPRLQGIPGCAQAKSPAFVSLGRASDVSRGDLWSAGGDLPRCPRLRSGRRRVAEAGVCPRNPAASPAPSNTSPSRKASSPGMNRSSRSVAMLSIRSPNSPLPSYPATRARCRPVPSARSPQARPDRIRATRFETWLAATVSSSTAGWAASTWAALPLPLPRLRLSRLRAPHGPPLPSLVLFRASWPAPSLQRPVSP
jgi:hypothetical protein